MLRAPSTGPRRAQWFCIHQALVRLSAILPWGCFPCVSVAEVTVKPVDNSTNVNILVDGQPFATYVTNSGGKPIVWPLVGPTGAEMTRAWPMRPVAGDAAEQDHIHHRSLWFTHGDVNGIDFWKEGADAGQIEHQEYLQLSSGKSGLVVTRNLWKDAHGKVVCQDERTLEFRATANERIIDFQLKLTALEEPVILGDTKEGTFAVRMPDPLRESAQLGGKIVNSRGQQGMSAAWGKPAEWVDYSGPLEGKTVGIAILEHPQSFRHPTRWHVRDYGLFAANPFGIHDFDNLPTPTGGHTLPPHQSLRFQYRVLLHTGDANTAHLAERYQEYVESTK